MADPDQLRMKEAMLGVSLRFEECGCCGGYHRNDFTGDCRDDANRFAPDQLDALYGVDGWLEFTLEDLEKAS